ncbi:hypothetical protein D3C85_1103620 [compost metagenome]
MVPGQQDIVRLIKERHFVLRVTRHADQAHLEAAQVDNLVGLYQPSHLEGRHDHMIDVAQVNRLRNTVEAILPPELTGEWRIHQVDALKIVQAAKVIEVQV